jgi:hypothetical protein
MSTIALTFLQGSWIVFPLARTVAGGVDGDDVCLVEAEARLPGDSAGRRIDGEGELSATEGPSDTLTLRSIALTSVIDSHIMCPRCQDRGQA